MKLRFTAFSMSSIDMKIVMMLRRKRNPATPSTNSTALRMRYQDKGTPVIFKTLVVGCRKQLSVVGCRLKSVPARAPVFPAGSDEQPATDNRQPTTVFDNRQPFFSLQLLPRQNN